MNNYKHEVCKYLNMDLDTELCNDFWELLYEKLIEKAEYKVDDGVINYFTK